MSRILDTVLFVLTAIVWTVTVYAVLHSDGICRGICDGCVYAGFCPQERK